jgi:hypothetical protein
MLNTFCAIDRGASRTTISVNGEYAHAGDRDYGCDGELLSDQRHHQGGIKAAVRYEHRGGGIAQVDGGAVFGKLDTSIDVDPLRNEYAMGVVGALLGWDFQNFGIDVGASIFWDSCSGEVLGFPRLNLRLGAIDKIWLETGAGPLDTPFDGRFAYGGLGFKYDWIRFNIGLAGIVRPMVDLEDNRLDLGTIADDTPDLGAYGQLSFRIGEHTFVNLGGILSENFSFQLGLSVAL